MAFYRNISMSFWTDSKIDDDFTPEDKYFFLFLMTNPHTNICGCYEISMKQMERETGYNSDTIKRLLIRMERTHDVIRYCEKTKEVLIINWGKYNWSASEKVRKAVVAVAEHIKHDPFKRYVMDRVSLLYTYDTVPSVTDTDTDTVSETVTEHRETADKPQTSKRFVPPTVEEVAEYCREKGYGIDPNRFVDYYTANGWRVGRVPMKDWKAAVRNWAGSDKKISQQKSKRTESSSIDDDMIDAIINNF